MNILAALFGSVLSAVPTWLLWNWLMPFVFGLPTINVFQAFGLLFLSYMIFHWG